MLPSMFGSLARGIRGAPRKFSKFLRTASGHFTKPGRRLEFPPGKDGDYLVKALEARGIAYAYRRGDEVPFDSSPWQRYLEFSINGLAYYYSFGGALISPGKKAGGPSSLDKRSRSFGRAKEPDQFHSAPARLQRA